MNPEEIRCGEVFCDLCGDCIACYGDDPCYGDMDADGEPGDHWYDARKQPEE